MELDKIRELVRLVEDSQIQELELSHRGETIRIACHDGDQLALLWQRRWQVPPPGLLARGGDPLAFRQRYRLR